MFHVSAIRARLAAGESKTAVAQSLGVSRQTLYSALGQCPA
ncbi:helix-turn-helix domain-containing protein [Halochromatium roseum]